MPAFHAVPKVLVTGGSGKLGRACVAHLLDHGWGVVNVDRVAPPRRLCPHIRADLSNAGEAFEAISGVEGHHAGVDAVVHLAAIPAPGVLTDGATFHHNMLATYNVFAGALRAGVRNIVWASSETVLGLPFATPPPYIPVDEEYPARPESTYSLVKYLEEQMAAQLCRRDPDLKMIGLRFSNVMDPEDYAVFPAFDADPALRRWNLWGYIDSRDGAQAVRRALEYPESGCEVFIVANADTVMSKPNHELVATSFPGVPYRGEVGSNETLLSISKARRMLGFDPEHSWRTQVRHPEG